MGIMKFIKGLVDSVRGAFNNDPRYTQNFDWYPGSGGGGGDVTKAYVDQQDAALARRIDGNSNDIDNILLHLTTLDTEVDNLDNDKADKENTYTKTETNSLLNNKADKATTLSGYGITNAYTKTETDSLLDNKADKATTLSGYGITDAYTKTETDTELDKKLDKRTTGTEVYSHSDGTQGAFTVKTAMSSSPTDTNMLTEKAVKDYVDGVADNKQGKITDSDQSSDPTDSTYLSDLSNTTNKRWTMSRIWNYIKGKITSVYYPVGTVIFNTGTNPSSTFGGTWSLYATGTKALYLDATAGTTVNEELPNPSITLANNGKKTIGTSGKGNVLVCKYNSTSANAWGIDYGSKQFRVEEELSAPIETASNHSHTVTIGNSTYKSGGKVRAEGITICAWKRTA